MDVEKWMNDNLGTVIGSALTLGGIIVALLIYLWQRRPKRLDYTVMYNAPVLSQRAQHSDLKVMYDEQELDNPHIVTVRVKNTGKEPVKGDEYQHDGITIRYKGEVSPLDASIPQESAPQLVGPILIDMTQDLVGTTPSLLNAKEWFDIQILSDGKPKAIEVSCRFVGQSRPMKDLDPTPVGALRLMFVAPILLAVGTLASVLFKSSPVGAVLITAGVTLFGLSMGSIMLRTLRTPADKNVGMPGAFF